MGLCFELLFWVCLLAYVVEVLHGWVCLFVFSVFWLLSLICNAVCGGLICFADSV